MATYVNTTEAEWNAVGTELSYAVFPNTETGHVDRRFLVGLNTIVDSGAIDRTWGVTVHFVAIDASAYLRERIAEALRTARNAVRLFWWKSAEEALCIPDLGPIFAPGQYLDKRGWSPRMHLNSLVRFAPLFRRETLARNLVCRDTDSELMPKDVELVDEWVVGRGKCLFYVWDKGTDPWSGRPVPEGGGSGYVLPYAGASAFPKGFRGTDAAHITRNLVTERGEVNDECVLQRCFPIPRSDVGSHLEKFWVPFGAGFELCSDSPGFGPTIISSSYVMKTERLTREVFLRFP
jgi:hypothetical protein